MVDIKSLLKKDSIIFEYNVKDLNRSKQFYQDIFGFEMVWDGSDEIGWCQLKLPVAGTTLGLNLIREGNIPSTSASLYFDTEDLDAVEKALKDKGVETKPIQDIPDNVSILIAMDPDGNEIGIVAPPRVKSK